MREHRGEASFEVELKFEVSAVAELPENSEFATLGLTARAPQQHRLEAVYFDTPSHGLAANHTAVRRREGGADAGWHLKFRTPEGTHEFHWPLSESPPEVLFARIAEVIGPVGGELVPIAAIHTDRTTIDLVDARGERQVELADDRVRSFDHFTQIARAWREWEAELAPGADREVLARIEPVLLRAGATRSRSVAKIARATGNDRA